VRRAHATEAARNDLPALGDELRKQAHVFVVDVIDLVGAELAHLLAAEELSSTTTAAFAASTTTRTRSAWTTATTSGTRSALLVSALTVRSGC
jgi:hypothetical protein